MLEKSQGIFRWMISGNPDMFWLRNKNINPRIIYKTSPYLELCTSIMRQCSSNEVSAFAKKLDIISCLSFLELMDRGVWCD